MAKITIVGTGVTGMTIAEKLCKTHTVTIVARNHPGDPDSLEWTSPWAGACFMCIDGSTPRVQKWQRDSFAIWEKFSKEEPESSIRSIYMEDLQDVTPLERIWYKDFMPDFKAIPKEKLPEDCGLGMSYRSMVLTPPIFLLWLRRKLEAAGVRFVRRNLRGLSDLKDEEHDIVINATGWGAGFLTDIADKNVQQVRGQTHLVKTSYDKIWIRHARDWRNYTYCLPRGDGTAILGGIKEFDDVEPNIKQDLKKDIFRRIHESLPEAFPSPDMKDFEVVRDIVGFRPERVGGPRVEPEILNGQKIIHAYGVSGGGFILGFGIAIEVADLVKNLLASSPGSSKL